jgi:hypothetical protein
MRKTFVSPTFITLPRKTKADKVVRLGLNIYRNLHHRTNNDVKKRYCESMVDVLDKVVLRTPIELTFQLYRKTKRQIDTANICCIVEKFFCDALVHWGCIEDDNYKYVVKTTYLPPIFGDEEYCEVCINEV